MTFEMYRYLSLGMAIACGIMVALSVVLFVKLQIPKVIADLTGRTAKKAIADIRRQNEQTGDKAYKSSSVNLRRGKLTDKMSPSGRIEARHTTPFGTGVITEKIASNKNLDTEISDGNETRKATLTLTVKKSEQKNFGFPENNVEITYNDNGNQYLLNASGGESTNSTISYQIKPESDYGVAEVTTKEDGQAILQIHKAGKVIVEATKSGDGNYKEAKATLTLNVKKAQQTISFGQTKVTEIYGITSFQQVAIFGEYCSKNDAKYEIVGANTIGAKIDSKTGELSFGDSDGKVGAITVKVTKNGDECYETCSKEYVLELKYLATPTTPYTLSGEKINDSGWFTDDVTVTAPDGYLVSHTGNRITTSDWAQSIVCDNEGENTGYTIYLKDRETGTMTDGIAVGDLKIDKTKPGKLSISYDENVAWQDISETRYGFARKPVTVTFTANDEVSGIGVVEYSMDGGNTFAELQKEQGAYQITIAPQYRDQVALKVTDHAGHTSDTLEDEKDGRILVVDSILPEIEAEFDGAYIYNEEDGWYYTSESSFAITFMVTDENYDLREKDPVIKVNDQVQKTVEWSSDETFGKAVLQLPDEGCYMVSVSFADRSGNEASYTASICVDRTKPERTVTFTSPSRVVDTKTMKDVDSSMVGDGVVAYYNTDAVVTLQIKEANFHPEDVALTMDGVDVPASGWKRSENDGDNVWRNELTLDQEGDHFIEMDYQDRAQNKMDSFQSHRIVIDKTAPIISIACENKDVKYTEEDRDYYAEKQTATITILEHNFRADDVVIHVTAKDAVGADLLPLNEAGFVESYANQGIDRSAWTPYVEGTWRNENDTYELSLVFDEDANYTFEIEYTDLATYQAQDSYAFTVDQTAPTNVKITYEEYDVGNTHYPQKYEDPQEGVAYAYYNDQVKVTVTAEDTVSGIRYFYYSYVNAPNVSSVNAELLDQRIDAERNGAEGIATFTIPREALARDNQFNGTVTVVAENRTEKRTEDIDTQRIVVDNIRPTMTVTYNDPIRSVEDTDFYGGDITGTIDITEANFFSEDVTLTCKAVDLAGNETVEILLEDEKAYEEVMFSINRNGSTFAYGNEFTENLVKQYYVYSVEEDVQIVEVNVDPIENYVIKLNGKQLTEGRDFTTMQTSKQGEWSKRMYFIRKDLFRAEGEYNIVVSTVDKAETTAFSDVKNLTVAFVVDQTKPVVTITGLETGGRYQSKEQLVTLIPSDEGGRLNSLYVVAFDSNGNPLRNQFGEDISVRFEMSGEAFLKYLEENDGKVTFTVPEGLNNQVQIVCTDCAVKSDHRTNEYHELFKRVTVSQNKLVIFYANKPAFFGSVAAAVGLIAVLVFVFLKRKSNHRTAL